MMAWPTKKLGELADISRGSSPRPICDTKYFKDGMVPWVKIADATKSGKFLYHTKEHVNDYGASFSRRLPPGTILVAASGTLGYTQILGVEGCAHDGWLILQNLRELDHDFAYYALKTVERHFFNSGSGAAIQNINTDILRQTEIPYPPLSAQRRIGGILSAYDELIENNQRRIKILEEMARSLYREWFVNFRFPGHDKAKMVPSPLGPIPQGWEVKKLGEVLELNYGKALKQDTRREGQIPVFGSSGIVGYHDTSLVKGPGIIVGRKGNVGSVFWSDADFYPIDTAYFVTSSLPLRFMFYELQTKNFINNDAAVPGLSRYQAYSLETIIPPSDLLTRFCRLADDFEQQASKLRHQIENLRRTRDLLLPRLLSGQVALEIGAN
jgi:type I restriction enzyme S subunit